MSPEAQRIAIAEACGWTGIHEEAHPAITYLWGYDTEFEHPKQRSIVPDYLNDLNAMHEAEKTLTQKERTRYEMSLLEEYGNPCFLYASASVRAEKFLQAKNLFT